MAKRKAPLSKDDVDSLSRGKRSRSRAGDRGLPHRLTKREREIFEVAKRTGTLVVPLVGTRANLVNVFHKWCEAAGIEPIIVTRKPG
jgi:hypothetical protein